MSPDARVGRAKKKKRLICAVNTNNVIVPENNKQMFTDACCVIVWSSVLSPLHRYTVLLSYHTRNNIKNKSPCSTRSCVMPIPKHGQDHPVKVKSEP